MRISLSLICLLITLVFPLSLPQTVDAADKETSQELTLQQAIERALSSNLNLQIQRTRLNQATGFAVKAEGVFDPQLTAEASTSSREETTLSSALPTEEKTTGWQVGIVKKFTTGSTVELGWSNSRYDSNSGQALLFNPSWRSALNLSVSQPLLQGFGQQIQTAELTAARKQQSATALNLDNQAVELTTAVAKAYWNLVYAINLREVRQLSLKLAIRLLHETETKIEAGTLASIDIYQPQAEVSRRKEEIIATERTIGLAEDELKLLLNTEDWQQTYLPTDTPKTYWQTPPATPDNTSLATAVDKRADIAAAREQREAAELLLRKTEDALRPELSLTASVGIGRVDDRYNDSVQESLQDPDTSWSAGLIFSKALGNSAAQGKNLQAKAKLKETELLEKALQQQLQKDIRAAIREIQLTRKSIEASRSTSVAAKKRLEAKQTRFAAGRGTTFDVLTAQQAYAAALEQEHLSYTNHAVAWAEFCRVRGISVVQSLPNLPDVHSRHQPLRE